MKRISLAAAMLLIGCGPQQEPAAKSGAEKQPAANPQQPPQQDPPQQPPADDSPGIAVGEPAPDFKLQDQAGQERSLKQLTAEQNVALVFYRSADW